MTNQRCPGREAFLDDHDLTPSAFRRVVAYRARRLGMEVARIDDPEQCSEAESFIEKVHLEPDFLPVSFLNDGSERVRAVCRIRIQTSRGTGFGTGFLVAPNVIMTNNHVLEDRSTATSSTAEFDFDNDQATIRRISFRPDQLFITDETLDFTLVACEPVDDVPVIPLLRNPALVTRHERVNIIQHPDARPKEVSVHDNRVERLMSRVVRYRTDTEPGSSGSPVFNNNWELVALHHAGVNQQGGQALNEGILISAIVSHLLARRGRERSESTMIDSVLDLQQGTNPQFGFFDTEGLIADPNVEVVVNGLVGSSEFCDVGFWNIENFNNGVSNSRVNGVAEVIANLGLDVFGLTEVQEGALDRLLPALRTRGFAADFELLDTRGSQDIAVLFDSTTTRVKKRDDLVQRHHRRLSKRTPTGRTAFPRFPLFVECSVQDDDGRSAKFLMIVVHLKAFGDAASRARRRLAAEMLAEIIDDIREQEGIQIVLGGDFNEKLDNDVLSALKSSPDLFSLTEDDATSGDRSAISFVGDRHRSLIDHIIVSRDVKTGDIMGDDAAIVRLDRDMPSFPDTISDHVPVAFRMVFRAAPVDVSDDVATDARRVDIPSGSNRLHLTFESASETTRRTENGKPKKKKRKEVKA